MYKIKTTLKPLMVLVVIFVVSTVLVACGDNNPQRTVVYNQQQPVYNWSTTDDGFVRYRWLNDGSCVVNFTGFQQVIPRTNYKGNVGPLSWKWENDGDIDISASGRKYDLDSPFDSDDGGEALGYDNEYYDEDGFGYEEAAGGALLGAGGYKLFNRQKKAKVFSYDTHGNPLDKRGRIISPYDKNGKPIKLVDAKGNPLPVSNTKLSKTWRPTAAPGMLSGTTASNTGGKTPTQLAVENKRLREEAAAKQLKIDRQKAELKKQQAANRKKNQAAKSKNKRKR